MRAVLAISLALLANACSAKSSPAPPDPEIESLSARGHDLFFGRAGCHTCHRVGDEGTQIVGPNLGLGDDQSAPVGLRQRHEYLVGIEYVVESIVDPEAFTVNGYARGVMKRYDEPPIGLSDDEIVALATFLSGPRNGCPRVDRAAVTRARLRIDKTRRNRAERGSIAP